VSVTTPETLPANAVVGELMPVVPESVIAIRPDPQQAQKIAYFPAAE
jgi:hypothetical protein